MKSKKLGRPCGTPKKKTVNALGSLISDYREFWNVSLKTIGNRLGVSAQFVCNIEAGRAPLPCKYIKKLAKIIDCEPKALAVAVLKSRDSETFKLFLLATQE